jgi:hypothetical protein
VVDIDRQQNGDDAMSRGDSVLCHRNLLTDCADGYLIIYLITNYTHPHDDEHVYYIVSVIIDSKYRMQIQMQSITVLKYTKHCPQQAATVVGFA